MTPQFLRHTQKKMKSERYEREKALMETLCGLGSAVGEYVGSGQGEVESDVQETAWTL